MVIGSIDDKMLALQHCNFVLQLFIVANAFYYALDQVLHVDLR